MKVRNGFVSNSSSSSFVIDRNYVSSQTLDDIIGHADIAKENAWNVSTTKTEVHCSTSMNNFDLREYVKNLGIPESAIEDLE